MGKKMIKLLIQHVVAVMAATLCGAGFAIAVTEALLPPVASGFAPRVAVVAIYSMWIAAGVYLAAVTILALKRHRQRRTAPLDVAVPALFISLGAIVLLVLLLCAVDRFNHCLSY